MKKYSLNFRTKHAGLSALLTAGALVALLLINFLAQEIPGEVDMTRNKLFSLTEQTQELLGGLEKEAVIYALYPTGQKPEEILQVLRNYQEANSLVKVQLVDPDRDPGLIGSFQEEENPLAMGSLIVASQDRYRVISGRDLYDVSYSQQGQPQVTGQKIEQKVSTALAYVSSGVQPKIYEIIGHSESTLAETGYQASLEQSNFTLQDLSLIRETQIPEDAAVVTLISPKSDLSELEIEKLRAYLEQGGRLFTALELTQEPLTRLYEMLESWDIQVHHGAVFEVQKNRLVPMFGDTPLIFAPFLQPHETTKALVESKLDPIFQTSLGFSRTSAKKGTLEYLPILSTSPRSWIRTDINNPEARSLAPLAGDREGPLDVALLVQEQDPDTQEPQGARLAVWGSGSSIKGLSMLGQIKANADLLINIINWAVGEEGTITIPSKSLFALPLQIDTARAYVYAALSVVIIPLIVLVFGLVIFLRRRHL